MSKKKNSRRKVNEEVPRKSDPANLFTRARCGKRITALRFLMLLAAGALLATALSGEKALTATATFQQSRTLTSDAPKSDPWDGAEATGNWVALDYARDDPYNYRNDTSKGICTNNGGPQDHYCDDTVIYVNVDSSFWKTHAGGLRVKIDRYRPNGLSDFDLYAYRWDAAKREITYSNDADGKPVAELITHGGLSHMGSAEGISIPKASGYYLIRVVYWAVTQSRYTGSAELVWSEPRPAEQQQPLGRQYSLASVSGGERPGPAVLYEETPYVPQLANHNPRFNASQLLVSGTEAYIKGEYLYQDYLYDDHGSDTDNGGPGACISGPEYVGNLTYPTDRARYGYNAADLVEFRVDVAPDSVAYRITLNTLLQRDSTIVAIAFDTDGDLTARPLPRDSGVNFPGPEEVITTWGTDAEHSRWDGAAWVTTPLAPPDTNLEANQITVVVPRQKADGATLSNPRGVWRATVAVGLYDRGNGGWLMPQQTADATKPGGASAADGKDPHPSGIFNLAFRFNEPVSLCNNPPDTKQAAALRLATTSPTTDSLKGYAHEIDFAALDAGSPSDADGDGFMDAEDNCPSIPNRDQADADANSVGDACRSAVPTHGMQVRIYPSRLFEVCDGAPGTCEGRDPSTTKQVWTEFPGYRGRLQPYSLYVPLKYAPGTPAGLTLFLHGAQSLYFQPTGTALVQQFGELRDDLLASPFGRGGISWWRNEGEYDVFEVWNDVANHFTLDPDSATLTGSSHGGYGVYRLGILYPDLFGRALALIAPPGEGAWVPPAPMTGVKQTGRITDLRAGDPATLTNLYLENVRNLPFMNVANATDELVPYPGPRAQNLGAPEFGIKGFNDYGYRFIFRTMEVSAHTFLFYTDIPGASEFLGDARIDRNPPHVTLAYMPAADEPDRHPCDIKVGQRQLLHNHAYWVSDLTPAQSDVRPCPTSDLSSNPGPTPTPDPLPEKGVIDVFSHASGFGDPSSQTPTPTQCIPGVTSEYCGTRTYTQVERTWAEQGLPLPGGKQNLLDLKLNNLSAATIDLARAGIDECQEITLVVKENDSACDLTLAGDFTAATADGASVSVNNNGLVVHLRETALLETEYRVTITPSCARPDLQVTNIKTSDNRAREGEKITITATITNAGSVGASASNSEILLDGVTVLGTVDTPTIPAGGMTTVSVNWDTRSVRGEHTMRVTADHTDTVAESDETNNAATFTVTVKGNKVANGSFEQSNASGTGPAAWSGSDTNAGNTSWSEGGSDGGRSVSVSGNGGNALIAGSPSWTSDAIAVTPGEMLTLAVTARSDNTSSPATAELVYLDATGNALCLFTALTAPRTTGGFATVQQLITIPAGVAQVRIVLRGFAPNDVATAGAVTFDEIGLFSY